MRSVKRWKNIDLCEDIERLQEIANACNDKMYILLRKNYTKLNHRLYDNYLLDDLRKYAERFINKAITLEKYILLYGEEVGTEFWNNYRQKQAHTNSFEYKNAKYGMSKDDFDKYNKSRGITEENLILKYGEEIGKSKYVSYVEKLKFSNSKEGFVEKYGDDGEKMWDEVSLAKSHNYDNYLLKYECPIIAGEMLAKFHNNVPQFTSKTGNSFCIDLFNTVQNLGFKCYHGSDGSKEFGLMCKNSKKYYMYDFVIPDLKIIVEYNGDYYHANPEIYKSDSRMRGGRCAQDVWDYDKMKNQAAIDHGYEVIVVWESQYLKDKQGVLNELFARISTKL